jgi:hypothetical protein
MRLPSIKEIQMMMTNNQILVVGATGATGRLLVEALLARGLRVKVIVRSAHRFSEMIKHHENLSVVEASVLELDDEEMVEHVDGCNAVVSCLGHTLSFKGMFGPPHRLVTEATRRLCSAVKVNNVNQPTKFLLMNTTGNRNRDLDEPLSLAQKFVIGLLRLLLPPHADNEDAADYLRTEIGQDNAAVEWVAVRPDGLTNEDAVTAYELYASPTRSAIFDAGQTSRINVSHFMADLITDDLLWNKWKGQMPVIYNNTTP